MKWLHVHLGTALALAVFLPEASAQCCKKACPPERMFFQNRPSANAVTVARGTRQETRQNPDASWNVAGAKPVRYDGLDLKIISGPPQRRLATVNNQTFLVGETLRVAVRGGDVRVRCLEIRERSVLVAVQGEPNPRELKLQAWQ